MRKQINWVEFLTIQSKVDNATNLTINNISLVECNNITIDKRCQFICKCGTKGDRKLTQIRYASGLFCKKCTNDNREIKKKETNIKKYGVKNVSQLEKIKEKKKATCKKNHGVEYSFQSEEIREKSKVTNLINLGVENPGQSEAIKNKIKTTNIKRHGVYHGQLLEVKENIKKNNLQTYGVEYPQQLEIIKNKIKATNIKRHGVECVLQLEEVKNKIKATNIKRHGVEYPSQSEAIKNKIKATNIKRHGVEYPSQSKEIREKSKVTNLERLGVEYPSQSEEIREKSKVTNLERLGVEYPSQSEAIKNKIKATNIKRHGVEYSMWNKDIFEKCQKTRFKLKPYTFKTGETIKCQGYEPYALKHLEHNHNYTYEDYINWNNLEFWYYTKGDKRHKYYPDIPFIKENKIIEVKSNYTFYADFYVNLLKAKCVLEKGFDFKFWVYDKKKELFIVGSKLITNKFIINNELLSYFKSLNI